MTCTCLADTPCLFFSSSSSARSDAVMILASCQLCRLWIGTRSVDATALKIFAQDPIMHVCIWTEHRWKQGDFGEKNVPSFPGDLYIARAAARNDVAEALPAPRIRSWAHLADSRSIHLAIWFFLLTYFFFLSIRPLCTFRHLSYWSTLVKRCSCHARTLFVL